MLETNLLTHQQNNLVKDFCSNLLKEEITYASAGLIEGNSLFSAFSRQSWQQSYVNFSLHLHDPSFIAAIQTDLSHLFKVA